MQFYKTIISLLLLLTYSFGFAHNLVPHCGEFANENYNEIQHYHHHKGGQDKNPEHQHIQHNDHADEGIYDFIVCLANETDDSGTECTIEHCFTFNSTDTSLKNISKLQTAIILFAVLQPIIQKEVITPSFTAIEINYLSPLIENSPHRGPPIM